MVACKMLLTTIEMGGPEKFNHGLRPNIEQGLLARWHYNNDKKATHWQSFQKLPTNG